MPAPAAFLTASLRESPQGAAVTRILAAALEAVEPGRAVRRFTRVEGDRLLVAGRTYPLSAFGRIGLLAAGKAAVPMAAALVDLLGERLHSGLVITKQTARIPPFPFPILEGDHPLPGSRSLQAGERAVAFVSTHGPQDLLVCLISGGGSALMTAPVEGVPLADLQTLTESLLACGARIDEINTLRRRLDRVKGGGLAKLAGGATVVSLILSDVVGNPLEAIASGPTAPDPTSAAEARAVLSKYRLGHPIPASIQQALGAAPASLRPGDPLFERVQNVIVGSNLLAARAALGQAAVEGFHPYLVRIDLQGEARESAFELATLLRQAWQTGEPAARPACLIVGGETTVTLQGKGKGGRNTELALAAVTDLADFPGVMLVTLASDGEDGPTDAAGAVVTGATFRRAARLGLHPVEHLNRNDSYAFFAALGDLLKPGPTGTNVNDLNFLFTF